MFATTFTAPDGRFHPAIRGTNEKYPRLLKLPETYLIEDQANLIAEAWLDEIIANLMKAGFRAT